MSLDSYVVLTYTYITYASIPGMPLVHGKPTEGDGELVLVKELRGSRTVRSTESALPRLLHTQFRVDGETVSLRLVRNTDIDTNVPFTFAKNKHEKVYVPDREVRHHNASFRSFFITSCIRLTVLLKRYVQYDNITKNKCLVV